MILQSVELRAFRNLAAQTIALARHATVVHGPNGQGKTNFLEAVYLLCTLRPLRAQKLSELVRIGDSDCAVTGRFELAGGVREVRVEIRDKQRQAFVDGKSVRDPDELFGGLATVAFTPDDLAIVKEGPDGRRKLLDRAVQNRHPSHLQDAREYLRALKSRNALLKQDAAPALIESFDEPLARLGTRMRTRRNEVLDEIRPHAARAFSEVARGEAELHLDYVASARDLPLLEALKERLPRDRERRFTSVGPHADELTIEIGDKSARTYASQGQTRAVVLAFKIGEIENLRAMQGRAPLLLLDDVSSELDPERNAYLMQYLKALNGQVVLTTTDPHLVTGGDLFYAVREGVLDAAADRPPRSA